MNEVIQLKPDYKGCCEHCHRYDILHNDEQPTHHHFGLVAEVTLYDVDGLETGNLIRGHDA